MRAHSLAIAAAASLGLASAGQAQGPQRLPAAVQAHVAGLHKECREYGGSPGPAPDLVKSADLNGDGLADYVVNIGAYVCEGAASALAAGQSGAGVTVFAGGPGGTATQAFSDTVYAANIETKAGKAQVFMEVGGAACGQRNAANVPFSNWTFCARPLVWNPAKRVFDYAPLSQARPIQ